MSKTPPRFHSIVSGAAAFFSGAAVMALELAGVRLIEPWLGSTIYIWGALIGIFMGALALGYWFGGALADKRPSFRTLGTVMMISAVLIGIIPPLAVAYVPVISARISDPKLLALAAALPLYALPCILLGMTSPFLIRMTAKDVSGIGKVSGSIYAIGTCGSLAGTFLVSFVLTELAGTIAILWGTGAVVLLTALLCFAADFRLRSFLGVFIAAWILFPCGVHAALAASHQRAFRTAFPHASAKTRASEQGAAIAMKESPYHLITIFESQFNYDKQSLLSAPYRARYLMFNSGTQGGCLLRDGKPVIPAETTSGYIRFLPLGVLITGKTPERVKMIGCGSGIGALALTLDYPEICSFEVADIDRTVFELAGKYFDYPYPDDPKTAIRSFVADGRQWLTRSPDASCDYLILDAYSNASRVPRHLISREFFRTAAAKLVPEGVLFINLVGDVASPKCRLVPAAVKALAAVFRHVYIFPRHVGMRSNVLVVASNHPGRTLTKQDLQMRLEAFQGNLMVQDVASAVNNFRTPAELPNYGDSPLLTDDFCPTDSMTN